MSYITLLIGTAILLFGVPIGNFLKKETQEENKPGQLWFKILAFLGLVGALIGLLIKNDVLLFSFAFISIVSSRSIKK